VVINLPDGKKIIYDKTATLVSNSKHVIGTRLQRVYDIDGKIKYHFWYEQPELGFTFKNGTSYKAFNRYENLVQVNYCKTNRIKRYTYGQYTKKLNGNEGSMQYSKGTKGYGKFMKEHITNEIITGKHEKTFIV
jgi:hypothetical protein